MGKFVIFLDDGGVMNDDRRRGEEWERLVGRFFVPILGGTPEAWAGANREVMSRHFTQQAWLDRLRTAKDVAAFDRAYQIDWIREMCALVGVPRPADQKSIALAVGAGAWITRRVRAAIPGAVEAIRTLHAQGYTLHTASGESSADLVGYLDGMGVRDYFGRFYGADLIGVFKDGPRFYRHLFRDARVKPSDALVVDDNPEQARWAWEVGATTVLIRDTFTDYTQSWQAIAQAGEQHHVVEHEVGATMVLKRVSRIYGEQSAVAEAPLLEQAVGASVPMPTRSVQYPGITRQITSLAELPRVVERLGRTRRRH